MPERSSPHILLIFPPVWVPIVPHLALPSLGAYLRAQGFNVSTWDANVDFFTQHLLTPHRLKELALRARHRVLRSSSIHPSWKRRSQEELPRWEETIPQVTSLLDVFRRPESFYDPVRLLDAQTRLHGLLDMVSVAYWPGRISFNHYRRGDIWSAEDLHRLTLDPHRNVFLPFWRERALPLLERLSPPVVGISISSIHQFISAMTLARLIRAHFPDIHVVVGGKHLLRIREKLLEHPLYFESYIHSAILHEGERPLRALLEAILEGKETGRVPNRISRKGQRTVETPRGEPEPLDDLPHPDFDDVPWHLYLIPHRYAPVRAAEGCYWGKCTFCARYGPEKALFMNPERVYEGLQRLHSRFGVSHVSVNDDCLPPRYWEELCGILASRGAPVSLLIWAKPVAEFTRRRLEQMAEAGVRQIRWGIESAHPRVLRMMRKGTTVPTMLRVLRDAKDVGIWNHGCFIIGFPTETQKEARATLRFIKEHSSVLHSFILYPFVLYEHSEVYRNPGRFGIRDIHVERTPFFDRVHYRPDRGMSPAEAVSLTKEFKDELLTESCERPFWHLLRIREYLQLYLDHYGLQETLDISAKGPSIPTESAQPGSA